MATNRKRLSPAKKIIIGLLVFVAVVAIGFQIFITYYLSPIIKKRLERVVVNGSDSLYQLNLGKFDINFWGGSANFSDLNITIDSNRYKIMNEGKQLPALTFNLAIHKGNINGIGIWSLLFSKKVDIDIISFKEADVELARHFRQAENTTVTSAAPLWKLIQPDLKSISISAVQFENLGVKYQNVDSAKSFRWEFNKCNALFTNLKVDSVAALDTTRMLFAKNLALAADSISMKTPDGLYGLAAKKIMYSSGSRSLDVEQFKFLPAVSDQQFIKHFGYQHEIYKLSIPVINLNNFQLAQWVNYNRLVTDTIKIASPVVSVHLDRNAAPNTQSKKGKYPHQLLQNAPFTIKIKRLLAQDGTVIYTEKNNLNQLTGKLTLDGLSGTIDNITNDTTMLARSSQCVADIRSRIMKAGKLHSIFNFNLRDKSGAFNVAATITNLDAGQLQPLFKAMTSTDLQSLDLHLIDYNISGNENVGTGRLRMQYDNMDILLNKVEEGNTFNKRGFLSFLANRLVIYKENPQKDEAERTANNIVVTRDATRSFFNFIWKTLFNSAKDIVLRPVAKRKIERRKEKTAAIIEKKNSVRKK